MLDLNYFDLTVIFFVLFQSILCYSHWKKVPHSIPGLTMGAFLFGVCMFSLCLHGLPLVLRFASTVIKT